MGNFVVPEAEIMQAINKKENSVKLDMNNKSKQEERKKNPDTGKFNNIHLNYHWVEEKIKITN